jgi:hypothetical protein
MCDGRSRDLARKIRPPKLHFLTKLPDMDVNDVQKKTYMRTRFVSMGSGKAAPFTRYKCEFLTKCK